MSRWRDALCSVGKPGSELARCEVCEGPFVVGDTARLLMSDAAVEPVYGHAACIDRIVAGCVKDGGTYLGDLGLRERVSVKRNSRRVRPVRLCDGCSGDAAREWRRWRAGWPCDRCWPSRFAT